MKTSIFFALLLIVSYSYALSPSDELENSPIFKMIMAQVQTKEGQKASGFNKIMALLQDLENSSWLIIHRTERQLYKLKLDCALRNSSIARNNKELSKQKMAIKKITAGKVNYVKAIGKAKAKILKSNFELKKFQEKHTKSVNNLRTFRVLRKKFNGQHENIKFTLSQIDDSKRLSKTTLLSLSDDLKFNLKLHKATIKSIAALDTTKNKKYGKQLLSLLKEVKAEKGSYIKLRIALKKLKETVELFNSFWNIKEVEQSNYNKVLFKHEGQIQHSKNQILILQSQKAQSKKLKVTKATNIKKLNEIIGLATKSSKILEKACFQRISTLESRIKNALLQKSLVKKLANYFKQHYAALSKSIKKKYN